MELDEVSEDLLRAELARRTRHRGLGLCDYCGMPSETRVCKYPDRHRAAGTKNDRTDET